MSWSCGIVGLPNVGKSLLYNTLTGGSAEVANYPFCTLEPHVGVIPIADERLQWLGELYRPQRLTPATLQVVDIAGLVRGASQGEGLGNQFLAHIREVDLLWHVVRCFEEPEVTHIYGSVEPCRDAEIVEMELLLKDMETVERRWQVLQKRLRRSLHKTHIPNTRQRHVECAGNWGGRQQKRVHIELELTQAFLCHYPEAVLLINDEQSQVMEAHIWTQQSVRPDDNINTPTLKSMEDFPLLPGTAEA